MSTPRLLLCTDLDRTLLPNGTQPESPQARPRFTRLVEQPDIVLAYVSGRDQGLIRQAMKNYRLPQPDFVISDVGTRIYDLRDGEWSVWPQWETEIAPDWADHTHQQLHELLADLPDLRLQESAKQNTFKLSYYVPLHAMQGMLETIVEERLQAHGIHASLIFSIDDPAGIGLLDILPASANKLHAVEFLRDSLAVPVANTLFAGDSGNDLPILASRIPAVLVANALPSVKDQAVEAARQAGHSNSLFLASDGIMGMNGNYSAGILAGVAHFHPELIAQLETGNTA